MVTRIALGLALAVAVATQVARAAGPPVVATANRRFDHDRHAASAGAAGKPAPCAACHDDKPRPDHARCAGCHQFPSSCTAMQTPGVAGPARLCRTCHTPTRTACLPGDLPALPTRASFSPRFPHARHLGVGAAIEKDCAVCHRAQAEPVKQKPHALCSGCHNPNGARPTMADCASCHASGPPPPRAPGGELDPFRLAGFDHRAHTTASKLTACLACHDQPAPPGDAPRAAMLGCQTRCHDGQKSFSATGTHCTMCHRAAAGAPASAASPDPGFSHAAHAKRSVRIEDCAACHVLETDGTLAAPLARKDHQPCASAGCHQIDYTVRAPKICGVCHESAAPWLRAAARASHAAPEWGEAMNHAAHLARAMTCETCHGDKRAGAESPHDHRACIGCHGRPASPQPPVMADCKACHAASRRAGLAASPWSVAATFEHTKHAIDPRSRKPTACGECHAQIAKATDMAAVARPRMADCDGCHDGKIEFKTTGFGCVRCHGPRPETAALAPRRGAP